MDINVTEWKIKQIGSHSIPEARFEAELHDIRKRFPSHVISQRSMDSLHRESVLHDLAYNHSTAWSGRLPERSVDPDCIAPEMIIPLPLPEELTDHIDSWIRWVAEDVKRPK